MRGLKGECLDRLIFFGESSLRRAVGQFLEHYHAERNHRGLGNRLISAGGEVGRRAGEVHCRERLGGVLRYYHRQAAKRRSFTPGLPNRLGTDPSGRAGSSLAVAGPR
jgi:putative transposase